VYGLGLSIPGAILLILGVRNRNAYLEWEQRNRVSVTTLLAPGRGWAGLAWQW
jgi:hypothetical protein